MKQAHYKWQSPKNPKEIGFGIVTLTDDNKTSISIENSNDYSSVQRYHIQQLGREIVAADFKHNSIIRFHEDNKHLINLLRNNTSDLLEKYIQRCRKFEGEEFERRQAWANSLPATFSQEWYDFFSIQTVTKPNAYGPGSSIQVVNDFYNHKTYRRSVNRVETITAYLSQGKEKAIELAEKNAKLHYESSLQKLAYRIEEKKLDINELSVVKSGIDINITITFTDGAKTVKAWTIVAEGPIVRPHYRYLVK